MTFKVNELMISLGTGMGVEEIGETCTGVTKPTGCINASIYWQAGAASRNLSTLKGQLRKAMTRA